MCLRWFYSIPREVREDRRTWLNRREETVISQLRIGHTGLNSTLFLMGNHQTGKCECGEDETVEHVALHCMKYQVQRYKLIRNLSNMKMKLDIVAERFEKQRISGYI